LIIFALLASAQAAEPKLFGLLYSVFMFFARAF